MSITSRQLRVLNRCPLSESGRKPEPNGDHSGDRNEECYLGVKRILIGKEGQIVAPSLELSSCEEVCEVVAAVQDRNDIEVV
jgi:hypothetical protein